MEETKIKTVKIAECEICGKLYDGVEAGNHVKETGHNKWTLIIPKQKRKKDSGQ